jgi:tRNA(Ile)-lysidine synthase
LAEEKRFSRIAVGHHRDDRAETILFNLVRGAGRQGVIGIPPRRGKIIRPFYDVSHEDILSYLQENNLQFMTDSSNRSPAYTRNRIRLKVIPILKTQITEAAVDNMIRFSEIIADEDAYLHRKASQIYSKLHSTTPGGKIKLDLRHELEYDLWLKRRLLVQLLADAGLYDIEYAEVARLINLIAGGSRRRFSLRNRLTAEIAEKVLYLYGPGKKIEMCSLPTPGRIEITHPGFWISFEYVDKRRVNKLSESPKCVAYIDAGSISGGIKVGGLKRGARFHPYGRPGSKKVGDFLTDLKYPRPLRDELPVISDRKGIVWLAGVEIDQRFALTSRTRKIAKLEIGRN